MEYKKREILNEDTIKFTILKYNPVGRIEVLDLISGKELQNSQTNEVKSSEYLYKLSINIKKRYIPIFESYFLSDIHKLLNEIEHVTNLKIKIMSSEDF